MKRLLLIVWTALSVISCNKVSNEGDTNSTLLSFGAKEAVWTTTRGFDYTGDSGTNPIPDMLVYGYYTGTKKWAAERTPAFPLFMNATVVNNSSGTWTYSPPHYFHPTGYHSFFAFAPYLLVAADSRNDFYFPISSETPVLKYHLPDDINNHEDLLFGYNTDIENGTNVVDIAFKHITSKITFSARVAAGYTSTVKINSILLNNIYTEATAGVDNISGSLDIVWGNYNDRRIVAATKNNHGLKDIVLTTTMQTISEKAIYMIPQEITTETSLTLSVSEISGGTERTYSKTFYLGATTWLPGKELNFQITYNAAGTEILLLVDPGTGDPESLTPIA